MKIVLGTAIAFAACLMVPSCDDAKDPGPPPKRPQVKTLAAHVPSGEQRRAIEGLERACRGWERWRKYVKKVRLRHEWYPIDHFVRKLYGWQRGYYVEVSLRESAALKVWSGHTLQYRVGESGVSIATPKAAAAERCHEQGECNNCLVKIGGLEFLKPDPKLLARCDPVLEHSLELGRKEDEETKNFVAGAHWRSCVEGWSDALAKCAVEAASWEALERCDDEL